jgi:5'-nucleotidase
VPNLPYEQLGGIRRAPLADFGAVQLTVAERNEGYLRMTLTDSDTELEAGTDEYWLAKGYVSITPIRPLAEATDVALPLEE